MGAADQLFLDVEIIPLRAGDLFILCSDGLEKEIAEKEISAMVEKSGTTPLSQLLLERALSYGARDNVTVITVAIDGEPGRQQADEGRFRTENKHGDAGDDQGTARNEQLPPS